MVTATSWALACSPAQNTISIKQSMCMHGKNACFHEMQQQCIRYQHLPAKVMACISCWPSSAASCTCTSVAAKNPTYQHSIAAHTQARNTTHTRVNTLACKRCQGRMRSSGRAFQQAYKYNTALGFKGTGMHINGIACKQPDMHHMQMQAHLYRERSSTTGYTRFGPMAQFVVHALKGLACRSRVTTASLPASHCKQSSALTSPSLHARSCASPSRAR